MPANRHAGRRITLVIAVPGADSELRRQVVTDIQSPVVQAIAGDVRKAVFECCFHGIHESIPGLETDKITRVALTLVGEVANRAEAVVFGLLGIAQEARARRERESLADQETPANAGMQEGGYEPGFKGSERRDRSGGEFLVAADQQPAIVLQAAAE